ncbi:MAG TPA: energy transducer TonB [Cytophagaceae bacterium]|jgi:protein TonB|nr:energy transducer TonB [Cytophagaceae bacterium]
MKKLILLFVLIVAACFHAHAQSPNYAPPEGKVVPVAEYYEGGKDAMYKFINQNINYPVNAKRNRIQGEVIITIDLAADGKVSGAKVVKNVGGGCGEEALRVVKLLKFKASGFGTRQNVSVYFRL